jgi:two-component system, OmpR family, phosphate regulon sensor histidine kinase PhoR
MKPFKSITIFLTFIVLFPVLFFSVYELKRISKNEKELLIIYNKQLESILFSINLYSEDVLNTWATKISANLDEKGDPDTIFLSKFLKDIPQLQSISFSNPDGSGLRIFSTTPGVYSSGLNREIKATIADSAQKIKRLITYFQGDYRKIEPLSINDNHTAILSFFLAGRQDSLKLVVLEINAQKFIPEILGQKIQATAENRMNIGIADKAESNLIYSVGTIKDVSDLQAWKPLWLFPQFNVGISLRDQDISTLSKEKNKLTFYLILLADFFFLVAGLLIFRNIRKEVRLAQIKSEFISNVSHEIRTPLALISMYAETLEMGRIANEDKKKEYYQVIYGETQRLSGIVNRILNFSKLESGKRTYDITRFDLNDLVKKVLPSYSFHMHAKGFEHTEHLHPESIFVEADFEALSDVFINLLDNAIKYSNSTKIIEIKTGIRGAFGFFEISDKGIGIAQEHRKLIFDKFYRVARGNLAYMAKGTGLGLTIVKNIVESHHGKTEVESKLGEGSTFRVLIPLNLPDHA